MSEKQLEHTVEFNFLPGQLEIEIFHPVWLIAKHTNSEKGREWEEEIFYWGMDIILISCFQNKPRVNDFLLERAMNWFVLLVLVHWEVKSSLHNPDNSSRKQPVYALEVSEFLKVAMNQCCVNSSFKLPALLSWAKPLK